MAQGWGWGTHLGANITALGPQLVDLGLSDVRPLLRLIQLMLHLAELGQVGVGLLLLQGFRGENEVRGGLGFSASQPEHWLLCPSSRLSPQQGHSPPPRPGACRP